MMEEVILVACSKTGFNIAVLQMTSTNNINENFNFVEQQIKNLNQSKVKLIVLPENFAFMGLNEQDKLFHAEDYQDGYIQNYISNLAKKYCIWIVAGTIPIKSESLQRCYASSIVFNAQGEIVARYDKIHLFDVQVSQQESHKESNTIIAGKDIVSLDTPVGRIGLSVCYDVRFPELYRSLSGENVDVFIVPAAFTFDTGKVHWELLLRARAVENLCYVLGSNQVGTHQNGRRTYGHSMIVGPWGEVLSSCSGDETGVAFANIDLEEMYQLRKRFPCLNHK